MVLDYVPCDACLEVPAKTWEEQEVYCSICRRLDRTIGYKATVRRMVEVPEPDVPEEVTVEPGPAPAVAPLAGSPLAVEFILQEASEDGKPPLPAPEADVQVVLEPFLVEPVVAEPAAEEASTEAEAPVVADEDEDAWVEEDPFGFTAPAGGRPEERAAAEAVDAKAADADDASAYTLEPWDEEDDTETVVTPGTDAEVDWPEYESEPAAEPEEAPWPEHEEAPEAPAEEAPWPEAEPQVAEEPEEDLWPADEETAPPEPAVAEPEEDDEWEEVDDVEEVDVDEIDDVEVTELPDDEDEAEEERR